jgi:uncharacterized protein YicC (UPF0701 family)
MGQAIMMYKFSHAWYIDIIPKKGMSIRQQEDQKQDELYNKATSKLEIALNIFRERGHLEGQSFCLKLLGDIVKKLKRSFMDYFD